MHGTRTFWMRFFYGFCMLRFLTGFMSPASPDDRHGHLIIGMLSYLSNAGIVLALVAAFLGTEVTKLAQKDFRNRSRGSYD